MLMGGREWTREMNITRARIGVRPASDRKKQDLMSCLRKQICASFSSYLCVRVLIFMLDITRRADEIS